MGRGAPSSAASASAKWQLDGRTSGISAAGTFSAASRSASHALRCTLKSMVREALLTSVTCTLPPVSCQISQLSTVPKASSPRSARARRPGTLSSSQTSLVAEKYASITRPVFSRMVSSMPSARSFAHSGSARRSCQTMAWCTGRPVARSHTSVVSRWLVMPMARMSVGFSFALASTSRAVASWPCQISIGSCSTQPGCG